MKFFYSILQGCNKVLVDKVAAKSHEMHPCSMIDGFMVIAPDDHIPAARVTLDALQKHCPEEFDVVKSFIRKICFYTSSPVVGEGTEIYLYPIMPEVHPDRVLIDFAADLVETAKVNEMASQGDYKVVTVFGRNNRKPALQLRRRVMDVLYDLRRKGALEEPYLSMTAEARSRYAQKKIQGWDFYGSEDYQAVMALTLNEIQRANPDAAQLISEQIDAFYISKDASNDIPGIRAVFLPDDIDVTQPFVWSDGAGYVATIAKRNALFEESLTGRQVDYNEAEILGDEVCLSLQETSAAG